MIDLVDEKAAEEGVQTSSVVLASNRGRRFRPRFRRSKGRSEIGENDGSRTVETDETHALYILHIRLDTYHQLLP